MSVEPCAPGVLRRRLTIDEVYGRMLNRWDAAVADHNGGLVIGFVSVPSLRSQVLAEFPFGAAKLAR